MEVETAACAQCGNPHISPLSLTAALAIYTLAIIRSMNIPDLCFVLYHLTLVVAVFIDASIFHGKLYLNTEFPARGVHAMNNIITNKMVYSTEH